MSKEKSFKEIQDFAEQLSKIPEHRPYSHTKTAEKNDKFITASEKLNKKIPQKPKKKLNFINVAMVLNSKKAKKNWYKINNKFLFIKQSIKKTW